MTHQECQEIISKGPPWWEAQRDEFQRNCKATIGPGETTRINPKYIESHFELALVSQEGIHHEPLAYRFATEERALAYMKGTDSDIVKRDIREYAVPPFVVTQADGTEKESW